MSKLPLLHKSIRKITNLNFQYNITCVYMQTPIQNVASKYQYNYVA